MSADSLPALFPDYVQTRLFLSSIDADEDRVWYFRCIHPLTGKVKKETGVVTGAPGMRLLKKLAAMNLDGWGIFVMVNHSHGSKLVDVDRIDVLYLDFDKTDDGHLDKLLASPMPVSLLVESSPGKHHGYLFVMREANLTLAEADDWMQVLLAHFGADNLHDPSRVMRVPGFIHNKDPNALFMTRMVDTDNAYVEYTREELSAWVEQLRLTLSKDITPSSKVVRTDGAEAATRLPHSANNAQIVDEMCSPEGPLHSNLVKLMGRMWADEVPVEKIEAFFSGLVPRIVASRGLARAKLYAEGEVERALLHCVEQERKHAEVAAKNRELNAGLGGGSLDGVMTLDDMLGRFVYCTRGMTVFDRENPRSVHSFDEFVAATQHCKTWVPNEDSGKGRYVATAQLWLKGDCAQVYNLTFHAGEGERVEDKEGHKCVNLWQDWRVKGVPGDASPFVNHVRVLFKDRADDFMDYLADIIQNPGKLIPRAWLHVSLNEGTGRNWLSSVLLRVMHGNIITNVDLPSLLESGYNGQLSQMCLAVVDELREGGSERWKHAQRFKQMITAETRRINPKFGKQHDEFNACQWLLFSNYIEAIPVEKGDRRIEAVINGDAPQPVEYFNHLYGLLDDPVFIAAVMHELKTRDISEFVKTRGAQAKNTLAKQAVTGANDDSEDCILADYHDDKEAWPWPLMTRDQVAMLSKIPTDAANAVRLGRKANAAGWVNVGRLRMKNGYMAIYARKLEYEFWSGSSAEKFRNGLKPGSEDGGSNVLRVAK